MSGAARVPGKESGNSSCCWRGTSKALIRPGERTSTTRKGGAMPRRGSTISGPYQWPYSVCHQLCADGGFRVPVAVTFKGSCRSSSPPHAYFRGRLSARASLRCDVKPGGELRISTRCAFLQWGKRCRCCGDESMSYREGAPERRFGQRFARSLFFYHSRLEGPVLLDEPGEREPELILRQTINLQMPFCPT